MDTSQLVSWKRKLDMTEIAMTLFLQISRFFPIQPTNKILQDRLPYVIISSI